MKHTLLKGYSVLSYFASLFGGFFIGLAVAVITEAGKGQMLAGGAIVLFYGIIGGFVALCLAFFIAYKANRKVVNTMSVFYALAIVSTAFLLRHNKQKRDKERNENQPKIEQKQPTQTKDKATSTKLVDKPLAFLTTDRAKQATKTGLGMFKPNLYEKRTLYFYGNITEGKSVQEHSPTDSITFKQSEYDGFDIATAPPWLAPDHLKLDYDILYFRVRTVGREFIEVAVNTITNQTALVDKQAGKIMYWPEFFMTVNSVEFPKPSKHKIHERPFEASGTVTKTYSFMRPLKIKQQWMYVELLTDDFQSIGKGWIQWLKDGELLIRYSLLS